MFWIFRSRDLLVVWEREIQDHDGDRHKMFIIPCPFSVVFSLTAKRHSISILSIFFKHFAQVKAKCLLCSTISLELQAPASSDPSHDNSKTILVGKTKQRRKKDETKTFRHDKLTQEKTQKQTVKFLTLARVACPSLFGVVCLLISLLSLPQFSLRDGSHKIGKHSDIIYWWKMCRRKSLTFIVSISRENTKRRKVEWQISR